MTLEAEYKRLHSDVLCPLAERLESLLRDYLSDAQRIDRITTRAKGIDRFLAKALKFEGDKLKYADPLGEIQDQIGARIVTFYVSDIKAVADIVLTYFRPIEEKLIIPESESEFGYVGKHFILFLPLDVLDEEITADRAPKVFELQIKTLFQHAWSEANHDLGYKADSPLSSDQKRRIAFTAAQAWGADHIFDSLHAETIKTA
ncbi:MAG: RelA/SpoT domain-containing protein [Planctomycetota bacterium]|nr:RelA/SpoT domain-containing protein [Planctomycetota bacterium]